ncbi:unnamed protein product [Trifolium pratense]|uniref:Uncharacterized protein n=1 Tax=Trifolium pratense TaxID=57577 RepID=A0ACB0JI05_TRIPR|nr:unnamed protein product [Trifolium pratense]
MTFAERTSYLSKGFLDTFLHKSIGKCSNLSNIITKIGHLSIICAQCVGRRLIDSIYDLEVNVADPEAWIFRSL